MAVRTVRRVRGVALVLALLFSPSAAALAEAACAAARSDIVDAAQVGTSARPSDVVAKDALSRRVMDEAVLKSVRETGTDAVGHGSWVTGRNYEGPLSGGTSDHDMRVLVAGETERAPMIEKWQGFKKSLEQNIRQVGAQHGLTPAETDRLIARTNVYPPNQITTTFGDAEDAKAFFTEHGHARLGPPTGDAALDGNYSTGAAAFRQGEEVKAGRLYRANAATDSAVRTSTDLTIATEGYERFFAAGEASNAQHWASEIERDLISGDYRALKKHAERLRTSLNKGRNLERVGRRFDLLDDVANGTVTDPSAIRQALAKARQDADLLRALSRESSARTRAMIIGFLNDDLGRWARMRNTFWRLAGKVPVDKLLTAFVIYSSYARTMDLSTIIDPREFGAAVLRGSAVELSWLAGPAVGIASEIADAVLSSAREGTFLIVTAFQDCSNLMAGVLSVKGREGLVPGMRIDQWARRLADTPDDRARLDNLVMTQATQASFRFERGGWVENTNIAQSLYARCKDVVLARWLDVRLDLIDEFNRLFVEWVKAMYVNQATLSLRPQTDQVVLRPEGGRPPFARLTAIGGLTVSSTVVDDLMRAMNPKLRILEGEGASDPLTLNREFRLLVDGRPVASTFDPDGIRFDITVTQPGEHTVTLEHEHALTGIFVSDDIVEHTPFVTRARVGIVKRYVKRASATFVAVVEPPRPSGTITISGPQSMLVGETATLGASVTFANASRPQLYVSWTLNGRIMGNEDSLLIRGSAPGAYEAVAELWLAGQPQAVRLARASHTLWVREPSRPQPPVRIEPPARGTPPSGGGTTGTPGSRTPATRTAETILGEYRALYPAYLQLRYPGATIEMRANATGSGNTYLCSYIAWGIHKDGPNKGKPFKVVEFARDFTLSGLDGLIPAMRKALGR